MGALAARKWWALGAITLAVLAVGLDVTVLSVALPTLAGALKASESDLQWFSSAYALVLAAAMLPAGVLGDRFGRKRILVGSLVVFGAGSIGCAYSVTPGEFIVARVVLGAAGAGIAIMALSSITVLFSEKERPRAVGVWATGNFLGLPVGPILGGWLLTHYWWGWIFLVNVPVAMVGLVAVLLLVPESRSLERPPLDPLGILAACAGLAVTTYGIIELGSRGWGDPPSLAAFVAGIGIIVGFFLWERHLTEQGGGRALIDLSLFRSRAYTWGMILAVLALLALIGLIFTLPQYSQGVLGLDPMGSGFRLLPAIGGLIVGVAPADRLARRIGAKLTVAVGFFIGTAGLLVGATTSIDSSTAFVAGWVAAVGFGIGIGFATAASAAMQKIPTERSGVASAMLQAMQKVGAPFGSAILGSVLVTAYQSHLDLAGLPRSVATVVKQSVFAGDAVANKLHSPALLASVHQTFLQGMDAALVVSAALAALAAVLALIFLPGMERVEGGDEEGVSVGRHA